VGLDCKHGYVQGELERNWQLRGSPYQKTPLTRVDLPLNPDHWQHDLTLEPGAPLVVQVAAHHYWLWTSIHILSGLLVGLVLPWLLVSRDWRYWSDWLLAGVCGLLLSLTILPSAFAMFMWLRGGQWRQGRLGAEQLVIGVLGLALLHMFVLSLVYFGLDSWLAAGE
jgi:hypothetical protein